MRITSLGNAGLAELRQTRERLRNVDGTLAAECVKEHPEPWIVAYSGGKDSTLLLQLVWETPSSLEPEKRRRRVYVAANDTLVESPLVRLS